MEAVGVFLTFHSIFEKEDWTPINNEGWDDTLFVPGFSIGYKKELTCSAHFLWFVPLLFEPMLSRGHRCPG